MIPPHYGATIESRGIQEQTQTSSCGRTYSQSKFCGTFSVLGLTQLRMKSSFNKLVTENIASPHEVGRGFVQQVHERVQLAREDSTSGLELTTGLSSLLLARCTSTGVSSAPNTTTATHEAERPGQPAACLRQATTEPEHWLRCNSSVQTLLPMYRPMVSGCVKSAFLGRNSLAL
jgi:hypothetical protein